MKNKIDVLDYAAHILKETKKGIIVTTKSNDKVNAMSISWGTLGIEWNKNIFIIFIRENRCTKSMLEETKEFCVNIPTSDIDRNIIKVCGTKSGYDTDKIKELNLTLEEPNIISVPSIKELIDQVPYSNPNLHYMQLGKPVDVDRFKEVCKDTSIFKLTWKMAVPEDKRSLYYYLRFGNL